MTTAVTSDVPGGLRIEGLPEHVVVRQLYLGCLSQASYLVGDAITGRAIVVDPRRDTDEVLSAAAAEGLTIEMVVETHFHADFLSGHLELAAATGAPIGIGSAGTTEYPSTPLHDGQVVDLGRVQVEVLETPGHTPESISLVVRPDVGAEPVAVLTGDTLFIGDVGRPDLLVSAGRSAEEMGAMLHRSLRRLMELPDAALVLPAHGAGSACGKSLSAETVSTIGEQRRTNYAVQPMAEAELVALVTEGQSEPPSTAATGRSSTTSASSRRRARRSSIGSSPTAPSSSTPGRSRTSPSATWPARSGSRSEVASPSRWAAWSIPTRP
jgi:glyoxylase-like metal-dependent hydrolase (beta-lactamase superfamily II)